ncbi:MAG: AMP-binding protein, partial [Chlamydiia bacterium]|nr:AMP-binding protein [Chlamydiia bacterium]
KWNVTLLTAAPTFLKGIFKAGTRETLHSLRLCILGAEAIPEHLMHLARELGIEKTLLEGYGITECSPVLTLNEPGTELVGVGRPINCVELMIVSAETHEPMPQGERGVVLARGPNIFSGYLNRDIDSPFVTVNGESWYWTGDMGYLDADGHLSLAGRLKRFVKIGGEMVSLGAIESAFYDHALETGAKMDAEVPNIAALGFEGDGKARLVLVTTFGIDANEANRVLRDRGFSNLVKISHAFKLPEIPVMGSGKIAYRQLESQFQTQGV